MDELEHSLRVLIEMDLYKRIKAITEGKFPNEREMINEAIKGFEESLPERLQQVSNKHSVIMDTINRVEKNEREMKRIRAKEERER